MTSRQITWLVQELTRDAVESFLWLTYGEFSWHSINLLQSRTVALAMGEDLLEVRFLIQSLQIRLQAWQKFAPYITSPHQRPRCIDLASLKLPVPGVNNNRLSQILKSSSVFKKVPIIFVSSNTNILTPEAIKAAGATDALAKPFSPESLRLMVRKHLGGGVERSLASTDARSI